MTFESHESRESCPPGLLIVADLLSRMPDRRLEILEYEMARRERERLLTRETRQLMSWHPFKTLRTILLSGVISFVLAWMLGLLASIGKSYTSLQSTKLTLPLPLLNDVVWNLGALVPTSTSLGLASQLPVVSLRDALVVGLVIVALVALEKAIFTVLHWKKVLLLREAEAILEQEIQQLKRWKSAGRIDEDDVRP